VLLSLIVDEFVLEAIPPLVGTVSLFVNYLELLRLFCKSLLEFGVLDLSLGVSVIFLAVTLATDYWLAALVVEAYLEVVLAPIAPVIVFEFVVLVLNFFSSS
jgi:hypothetical protein